MKNIKTFETEVELEKAVEILENNDIHCDSYSDGNVFTLRVHVGDFIKARDIIIERQS